MAVVVVLLLGVPGACADDEAQAKALFEAGVAHADANDYAAAVEKFRASYKLSNRPKILLNIGGALAFQGRNAELADVYEEYLLHPLRDRDKAAEVSKLLASLDAKLGRVHLRVKRSGEVSLDARVVGSGPLDRIIRLDPGEHIFEVVGHGTPVRRVVRVSAGKRVVVAVDTVATVASPSPALVQPSQPRASSSRSLWREPALWTGLATAVAAGAGVGLGLAAQSAFDEFDEINSDSGSHDFSEAKAVQSRGESRALWSNVSFASAGALGLATGILLVLRVTSSSAERPVGISAGPTGASVGWAF